MALEDTNGLGLLGSVEGGGGKALNNPACQELLCSRRWVIRPGTCFPLRQGYEGHGKQVLQYLCSGASGDTECSRRVCGGMTGRRCWRTRRVKKALDLLPDQPAQTQGGARLGSLALGYITSPFQGWCMAGWSRQKENATVQDAISSGEQGLRMKGAAKAKARSKGQKGHKRPKGHSAPRQPDI